MTPYSRDWFQRNHLQKLHVFSNLYPPGTTEMSRILTILDGMPDWAKVDDFLPDDEQHRLRLMLLLPFESELTKFELVALMFVLPIDALKFYVHPGSHDATVRSLADLKHLVQRFCARDEREGQTTVLIAGTASHHRYPIAPFSDEAGLACDFKAPIAMFYDDGDCEMIQELKLELKKPKPPKIMWNTRESSLKITGKGYRCIVTESAYPDISFVTPLSWNEDIDESLRTETQLSSYSGLFGSGPDVNALMAREGCSFQAWNMICLKPELRLLWHQCRFGLKYVGHGDSGDNGLDKEVRVQFVWMPLMPGTDTWERPNLRAEMDRENKERTIDKLRQSQEDAQQPVVDRKGRNVITGRIFGIRVREEDLQLFVDMLKLQWNLIRLAAMSGIAQAKLDDAPQCRPSVILTPGTSLADTWTELF